jgi:hypothetical protein
MNDLNSSTSLSLDVNIFPQQIHFMYITSLSPGTLRTAQEYQAHCMITTKETVIEPFNDGLVKCQP